MVSILHVGQRMRSGRRVRVWPMDCISRTHTYVRRSWRSSGGLGGWGKKGGSLPETRYSSCCKSAFGT